jgi:hypothetical protein
MVPTSKIRRFDDGEAMPLVGVEVEQPSVLVQLRTNSEHTRKKMRKKIKRLSIVSQLVSQFFFFLAVSCNRCVMESGAKE